MIWHTQGSGKSLTMLWLATKLRREPRLGNQTIVVVTDRTQLDRQIANTFKRCGFPSPEQTVGTSDLRRLLTTGTGRTVMTTIQKFEDVLAAPGNEREVLNPSENVVVMVDEAHRTQYGSGRTHVRSTAQHHAHRLHGHTHRQGIPAQHHGAIQPAYRFLHHSPI